MPNFLFFIKPKVAVIIGASFIILFLASAVPVPLKLEPIILHPQTLSVTSKEFYIAKVVDERTEKTAVAWIFPPSVLKQKSTMQVVDLQGGGLNAIQDFIWQSFPQDKKLHPILIHLKECKVTELQTTPGRIEGKVAFAVSFDLQAGEEQIHLTDYRIDTKYTRPDNQSNMVEPALRESIISALKYLNTWMNNQADHNPNLATAVKISFKDHQEKLEGDTIYYAVNRPLTWNDFQEKPRSGKYAAVVFPSFGFEEHQEVVNGVIRLQLDMKIYVPKSACWVKDDARNDYVLNHEQRHFDLVAIIGKRFEQDLLSQKIPVRNYEGLINVKFYDYFRQMNIIQKKYDDETLHGTNSIMQKEWDDYIYKELLKIGIVKQAFIHN